MDYSSIAELFALATRVQDAVRAAYRGDSDADIRMREALHVMRESVADGMQPDLKSVSGMTGGQAAKIDPEKALGGRTLARASAIALAVAESNAAMGRIVAAPTAGACGILPGALFATEEAHGYTEDELIDALFTAAGVGRVIAMRASISGAQGGCQAECGSASAMAAAENTSFFVLFCTLVDIKKSSLKMHARRGCNIVASFRRYYPVQVVRVRSEAFLSNMLP